MLCRQAQQVRVTSVLLLETLSQDTQHLLERRLHTRLQFSGCWQNSARNGTTDQWTQFYMAQLTERQYNKLVKIYQVDFDIFGYDIPSFDFIIAG